MLISTAFQGVRKRKAIASGSRETPFHGSSFQVDGRQKFSKSGRRTQAEGDCERKQRDAIFRSRRGTLLADGAGFRLNISKKTLGGCSVYNFKLIHVQITVGA